MTELTWVEVEHGKWQADDPPHVWNMLWVRANEYRFYCDAQFMGFGTCFRDAVQNADLMRLFPSAFPRASRAQGPSLEVQTKSMADVITDDLAKPHPSTWTEHTEGRYRTWVTAGSGVVLHIIEIRTDRYEFYRAGEFIGWSSSFDGARGHLERGEREDVTMLTPAMEPSRQLPPLFSLAGQTIFQISGASGAPALEWESYPNEPTLTLRKGDSLDRRTAIQRTRAEFEEEQYRMRGRAATGP